VHHSSRAAVPVLHIRPREELVDHSCLAQSVQPHGLAEGGHLQVQVAVQQDPPDIPAAADRHGLLAAELHQQNVDYLARHRSDPSHSGLPGCGHAPRLQRPVAVLPNAHRQGYQTDRPIQCHRLENHIHEQQTQIVRE